MEEKKEKKKNKFVAWWLGLSKPIKGVLICATSIGLVSAVVFPTLAATGVLGNKSNTNIIESEWKSAFDIININKPSVTGNFKLNATSRGSNMLILVDGCKSASSCNEKTEYVQFKSNGDAYFWEDSNWEAVGSHAEQIIFIVYENLFIDDCYKNFTSFNKIQNNLYKGTLSVTLSEKTYELDFEIGFANKLINSIKATYQQAALIEATFSDYNSVTMPSDYPTDPLP